MPQRPDGLNGYAVLVRVEVDAQDPHEAAVFAFDRLRSTQHGTFTADVVSNVSGKDYTTPIVLTVGKGKTPMTQRATYNGGR